MPEPSKPPMPVFDVQLTEAVSNILAATDRPGLTKGELISALRPARLEWEDGENKRAALLRLLHNAQVRRGRGDTLVVFVNAALNPSRYVNDHARFDRLRGQLNELLSLYGFKITEQGKFARGQQAATLSEAARLSGELVSELRRRGCHQLLLTYCGEELVRKSLFHAISEASKSIPDRIRRHTGLGEDGEDLYGRVFGTKTVAPLITVTAMSNDSETSEHRGFKNLLTGIHGHYRNPRAHATRLGSSEEHNDFFDAFALFSYVHRRLDQAGVRP
ncbi:TIGR02391 family protein [Microlunatus flavus]|uniref:TIGR02391 family protein n=1 Tax=Microlunatus flavus TaxID=1036181 RepID=A0A1H9IIY4_9ACTN|nr:TIGR02391 family protein [Microlunatus flavus]SEQ74570.1 TIGR02391 family protein [Microlunatus flavus]